MFEEVPLDMAVLFDIQSLPGHYGGTARLETSLDRLCKDHNWKWHTDEIYIYITKL